MPFRHIDTWVFDLDNTLYPGQAEILERVHDKINAFIMDYFNIPLEAAETKRKGFYKTYGTTLYGMISEHGINPDDYLRRVHEVDISGIPLCPVTARGLEVLPGRRIVFTNSAREHAERILSHLGIRHLFEDIYDIRAAGYVSKPHPAPYAALLERYAITPKTACMVEDMAKNLVTAHACGMTTVWISGGQILDEAIPYEAVHHRFETLKEWMEKHV